MDTLQATTTFPALFSLFIFSISYLLVFIEEWIHLPKSKPLLLASGIIWALVAYLGLKQGQLPLIQEKLSHSLLDFINLFLFLASTIIYMNVLEQQNVFTSLSSYLQRQNFSLRHLFWLTGILSFILSTFLNNLTTALLLGAVIMAIGRGNSRFICLASINIVVAANAGGVMTPFGDITTLIIWQANHVGTLTLLKLFLPAVISFVIPAFLMQFQIPNQQLSSTAAPIKADPKSRWVIALFILTIATAIIFRQVFLLPASLGMVLGLGYLECFFHKSDWIAATQNAPRRILYHQWDTLFFFYGVILCVGGLETLGFLSKMSQTLYPVASATSGWGFYETALANGAIGLFSAIIDNVPIVYAVLAMNPPMPASQWLLVTLTSGIGGSLLAIGSAAGVALLGQMRGHYTFLKHLRWSWAIALGYIAACVVHVFLM